MYVSCLGPVEMCPMQGLGYLSLSIRMCPTSVSIVVSVSDMSCLEFAPLGRRGYRIFPGGGAKVSAI